MAARATVTFDSGGGRKGNKSAILTCLPPSLRRVLTQRGIVIQSFDSLPSFSMRTKWMTAVAIMKSQLYTDNNIKSDRHESPGSSRASCKIMLEGGFIKYPQPVVVSGRHVIKHRGVREKSDLMSVFCPPHLIRTW